MSTKPNYFKIGLFIIVATILSVSAVVIWGAGLFKNDKIYYETYFDSSVAGLTAGSSVLLMGVKIGQVESIEFVATVYNITADPNKVSKYERYVRVVCSLGVEEARKRAGNITEQQRAVRIKDMVKQGLRLRLASNILTGQAYLEGVFLDPKRSVPLEITWKPKYLYVPSTPGSFATMKDSIDKILIKLEDIDITGMSEEIKGLFAELRQTNTRVQTLLTSPDPNAEIANVAQVLVKFDNTLGVINSKLRTEGPQIDTFLRNLRAISEDVKELTAMLKEHPSGIIFSKPPSKSEIVK